MSIVSSIESHFEALRAKVGTLSAELEQHIANFLSLAKAEEAAAEAKVQAEIDHLKSLGYSIVEPGRAERAETGPIAAAVGLPADDVARDVERADFSR